ncbi:MAG: hypothetical protein HY907_04385 [Deltaproteobacteria bacterium]|nr:hypothetical protein [Deltaproteobacteria bacterium]
MLSGHRHGLPFLVLLGALLLVPLSAGAARYRIDSRTSALLYPIIGRDGIGEVDAQILQTRLRLRIDDLLPVESDAADPLVAPDLAFDLSVRLFGDFGVPSGANDPAGLDFVPGVDAFSPEIQFAFFEATNLAGGWIDAVRAGRLIHTTVLGWRSDDGALIRFGYEEYFHLQLAGGIENIPGFDFLSASPFAPEGVERWQENGDGARRYQHNNANGGQLTPREPQARPTVQATADGVVGPVGYEVGYRHTWLSFDGKAAQQVAGIRLDGDLDPVFLSTSLRADIGGAAVSDADASVDVRLGGGRHRIGLQYDYFRPTFDLDSIFWVFASDPFHEATVRYRFPLVGALSGQVWATLRSVEDTSDAGDNEDGALAPFTDAGGGLGLTLRRPLWNVAAKWKVMRGAATNLAAFDLSGRVAVFDWWDLYAIGSIWQYEDRLRDAYHGLGGAGRLGASFDVVPDIVGIDGEFQAAYDPREGTTFAGFVWLDLGVVL